MATVTQAERITALEVQVKLLVEENKEISGKLDELLTLKHKGMGAFWLAAMVIGTGISQLVTWFRG